MNQIQRLHSNIKILLKVGLLDDEFAVWEKELSECNSLEELNTAIEDEHYYMAQDAEK